VEGLAGPVDACQRHADRAQPDMIGKLRRPSGAPL
jgi:hypothetical protein